MTPNPQALRQRRAINKLSRPSVADELASALSDALDYLDRMPDALKVSVAEVAQCGVRYHCRVALARYNTEKKT